MLGCHLLLARLGPPPQLTCHLEMVTLFHLFIKHHHHDWDSFPLVQI